MTANDKNLDLQNSFISSFLPISNYFLLYPVLLNSDSILFNILFQVIAFIVLSFLMVVIYYISQQSNFDNPIIKQLKSTWGFISELTDKILVVPVFGLTVGNLSCNFSSLQTQCYSTMNIILIVLSILCSIMLLFLEVLFSYLFFNFTFKIKDSISRNPSGMPIFFFLYRLGITIFQSLFDLNVKSTYTILVLLHLIFGLIMMYDSLNNFPYHNKNVSKAQGIFASAYLWINATFLLLQLTSIDMLHENVLVIMGLGMAFFLKLFLNIRNYFVKVLMNSELDEIQSAVLLDLKLRNYNTLAKTLDIKKSELLLASLLKIHSDKCTNVTCPCKKRSNLIDPKKKIVISDKQPSKDVRFKQSRQESTTQLHRDQVFVKHFIARMAKDGLNKFKDSKLLYLDYMYYRFEALRLYSSIYFEVSKFEGRYHNDMSLSIEFCLYRLRARLRKYLIGRNQKSEISRRLMLENVKAFDEGIIKQKANILDVNRNLIDLWESLSEEKPDLSKLLDIGNSAIRNMQVTSDQYEFLLLLNNQSQDLKNLMTIYSNYLAYDDLLAKKIEKDIEQSRDMENDNSFHQDFSLLIKKYQIFDKQSCVLSISPQSETLGQIVWCSRNVVNVFGYDESELLTMNINQLMPEPIAINHNKILKNFYDNGRELYTTKMTHVWGIDANKICFSANIFIKILAKLDTYDIVGFVHKLNQEDYIIADPDGMIYGVGKKVSEHIEMLPEYVIESKVNIQLLSPGINEIFKDYFTQFEGVGQSMIKGNDNKMSYDDFNNKNEMQKDQKYFFLISENQQQKIQSFIDTRASVFKKNNFDLITKEPINQENSQGANNYIKSIKQNFEFKKEYASLFYKVNSKILIKTLCRMVKVKVQVKNFTFWNGSKLQRLKIIKINSYETKDNAYIRTNRKKIKELGIKVTELYCKVKEAVNDFKQKKMKQKQQEEQENVDELEDKVRIGDQGEENPEGQQMKGFANLFKKGGRGGGRQSIFQKMNKMGGGKGKTEQNENQLRQGILMTLFKPNLGKKNAKYKRQSKNSGSVAQVYGENREDQEDDQFTRKKIEIPQEQLDQIKKCVAIPKIWQVLFKANIVGNSEWSVFYEKKKEFPEDELALKFKRIRDICKSKKFLEYKDKILDPVNESHSSNTDNIDYENNSIKDDDSQLEERSLIRNLQVNQGAGEEEKAAMQSVSSSTQSLQAHNAQRMLREQLKNMQAPTILIIAHYTMIFLCVMLFTLIISQYGIAVNDFNGIKSEIQMYERLSNYSDNLIELLDGYYSLQMINEGPFKDIPIYNATWQSQFREKIIQNEQLMVQFFLNDFSQAGAQSQSGNDLRSYLFVSMDAQLLVNGNAKLFSVNYENYVRLLLNAVNVTINLDISQFSINSSQDYFYYIYHNLEEFNQITILNYNLITDFLISSKDSLINQFYAFWFSCFSILFLLYLLIYPIILKTKLKIQETLRIFTKISLADVEYYSTHYKMIFYEFKGSQDSPQVLKKIEDSALKTWEEKKRKDKENNTKNLARSRSHKGIQINKVVFFLVMTLWLLIFSGLLFVKDYFLIQFANKLNLLYESQETQHKLKFIYQMEYVNFKNAYFNNYIDQTNMTRLEEQFTSIGDIQISKIFTDQYEQLEIYSSDLSYLVNQLSTNNTCYFIQNSLNDFPYASLEDCESLLQGILKQGLLNFYQQLKLEMMSGITQLQRTLNKTQMVNYISQQRFQDYNSAFYYAKLTNQLWSKSSRQGLYIGIDNEINFNQYFVIILSILLALFLILVWGREYMNLKRNSRWVNGFILLIPSQLRSENKHINSFLKNQLKIQGLMYL